MQRFRNLSRLLLTTAVVLVGVDAEAQRGRGSSSQSSGSSYRSSGTTRSAPSRPSISRPAPSVSRPSSTSSRPTYTRPSYSRPTTSSSASWRSGSTRDTGSYVRPSTRRGSTRYVPSGSSYGSSDRFGSSTGSRPTTRYDSTPSSSTGSSYGSYTPTGDLGRLSGSDLYSSRGDTSVNTSSDALRGEGDAGPVSGDGYVAPSRRSPAFPRAYRPSTYTPRTYAPRPYRDAGVVDTTRGSSNDRPGATRGPRDISDIADRYRGGSTRGGRTASGTSAGGYFESGGRLGSRVEVDADATPYGRGPLGRLAPSRGGSKSTDGGRSSGGRGNGAPATTGGATTGSSGGRLALPNVSGSTRNTPGTLAPRPAGSVAGGGTAGGGAGGYVTPGGSGGSTTITLGGYYGGYYGGHHHHGYHHGWGYSPFHWWGWYAWCVPYYSYHWYWGSYYPLYHHDDYYYDDAYGTVVYTDSVVVVDDTVVVGEGAIDYGASAVPEAVSSPEEQLSLSTAADRYLHLGDRAFREGRFGDAVHFYAKAVEFAPDEGVLYLVLADALFATGDYHYAAFAIRKSLELDPALADATIDKHAFYGDPGEFDRQLAVLEMYVDDHPTDTDSRLVLALNYLFANRAGAALDLLESPYSERLRGDDAAALIREAARRAG